MPTSPPNESSLSIKQQLAEAQQFYEESLRKDKPFGVLKKIRNKIKELKTKETNLSKRVEES